MERYCPRTNEWTSVENMHEARYTVYNIATMSESEPEFSLSTLLLSRFGCAVVAHQGRIYVGGGFGQDKAILCSVESYDPDTDKVSQSSVSRTALFPR